MQSRFKVVSVAFMLIMSLLVVQSQDTVLSGEALTEVPDGIYLYSRPTNFVSRSGLEWSPNIPQFLDLRPSVISYEGQDALNVALEVVPESLDPLADEVLAPSLMYSVYETLVEVDAESGELMSGLAESWDWVGMTTLEFRLREDVLFHDGTPMTADYVAAAFGEERTSADLVGATYLQSMMSTVSEIVVVDDYTLQFVVSRPDPTLESRFASQASAVIGFAGDIPVGTGPYQVASLDADTVMLEAFAEYWGGAPSISTVTITAVASASSRVDGLLAGEYDLVNRIGLDQAERLLSDDDVQFLSGALSFVNIETDAANDNSMLSNPTLHEAMNLASGAGLLVFDTESNPVAMVGEYYDYDLAAAEVLLAESGYAGEEIVYHVMDADAIQMAAANDLAALWEQIGVNVRIESEAPASNRMFSWTAPLPSIYDQFWEPVTTPPYDTIPKDSQYAVYAPF